MSSSYRETKQFLEQHTRVIELADETGARVAVCPEWVGRVMTSTCGGDDGPSFGFVNREFIESGKNDPKFNNYGGEERLWLSPEGGQFSLWFKPGQQQTFDNWLTPPALNEGAWTVAPDTGRHVCRMKTRMRLQNASATQFDVDVAREVRLLGTGLLSELFGDLAADTFARGGADTVAYETVNRIDNRGGTFREATGMLSIWILGMFNASPQTVVVVPYRGGDVDAFGPVVKSDYFGDVPAERLRVLPEAVLFAADGKHRAKIGTSRRRARNVLGSIDFQSGVLTLVHFTMPDDTAEHRYMNNMWELPLAEPYRGDVANAYNDGPNESGQQLGAFYEIESLSPATALHAGESLEHRHRTIHVRADAETLAVLAREILGVDLALVRKRMLPD
ncbi:MAG: hypothetical protein HQ567_17665 [Candidatus Nealsonbacteria bacterium]|nr:hypothetical protein [Candidatus Nealsonbacteria bacterium]